MKVAIVINNCVCQVREGQLAQYNFILVIGQDEVDKGGVNVRTRDNTVHGFKKIEDLLVDWHNLVSNHVNEL